MKKVEEMTFEERMLRAIICDMRNEFIGGFENMTYDCSEEECEKYWPLKNRTKESAVNTILSQIIGGKDKYIQSPQRPIALEKKHLKFMGKQFIKELIEDRVEADYQKHGWDFLHNYDGNLK